jgi:hypothetical protein
VIGDFTYGPFALSPALVDRLAGVPASFGWGWRTFLFVAAHRHGSGCAFVEGDYACPDDQRQDSEEERRHRVRQLAQNLGGIVHAWEA